MTTPPMTDTAGKWTQGSWQAIGSHESEGFDCYWIKSQPNAFMRGFTKEIAAVTGPQGGEAEANARLIAAAPDLYEVGAGRVKNAQRPAVGQDIQQVPLYMEGATILRRKDVA